MTADDRVHPLVGPSLDRLAGSPALGPLRSEFLDIGAGLAGPMRVALIGRVSAGKSTLANALLGGYRAPTGITELTYNVTWITHGADPSVMVHFTDGRPPERHDPADLERLTVRGGPTPTGGLGDDLSAISYLKVFDPATYLDRLDLIDTPGLDSVIGDDSANTLRFLGGPVDALVLVVSRAVHTAESALLERLHSSALTARPINSIGALTKIENHWSWPDSPDPHAVARRVADQALGVPAVAAVLYRLVPVASLVGAAAAELGEPEAVAFAELARLDVDRLGWALSSADGFAGDDSLPLTPEWRRSLYRRLRGYGVMLGCELVREGVTDPGALRAELDRRSGMAALRDLLVDHFGGRSDLVKLNRAYSRVRGLPDEHPDLPAQDRLALFDAMAAFDERGRAGGHRFRELEVLRAVYDGELDELSAADTEDLLRVTGERGTSTAARLGAEADAVTDELQELAQAGLRRWALLDATGGYGGADRTAVAAGRRAYEVLLGELGELR